MKVYISGQITNLDFDDANFQFDQAKLYLTKIGFNVVNPMELAHKHSREWIDYMIEDISALKGCDAIATLQNWVNSEGAKIEVAIARRMGLMIIELPF